MANFLVREIQKLEGHKARVCILNWKPGPVEGEPALLASCSADNTVRIWEQDPATGSFHCKKVFEGKVFRSCALTPYILVTTSFDATNDTTHWEDFRYDFSRESAYKVPKMEVKCVACSTTGYYIAMCGWGKSSIDVWVNSTLTGFRHEETLEGHTGDVQMVKWNPTFSSEEEKDILFSFSSDKSIKIWTGEWGCEEDVECIDTLDASVGGHRSTVWAFSFNASGDKMVSCSDDCTIKIWEANFDTAPPQRWIISGDLPHYHELPVLSIHWSREGIICSGGADGSICFIDGINDSANGPKFKLLHRKKKAHEKGVHSVQWSSKENRVLASASDDGTIKIWELHS